MSTTTKKFPARIVSIAAAAALALGIGAAAVAANSNDAPAAAQDRQAIAEEILATHGVTDMDAVAVIEKLDQQELADRPSTELWASVRRDELLIVDTTTGREGALPMPDGKFYMSFAPYFTQTHPCHFHSLTTCTGEIQNTDIEVHIVDNATGEVLVDDTMATYANGFLGVWLPRDLEVTLTVTLDGQSGSSVFTTTEADDATCDTTIRLT